jgi:sugar phosphate permease
MADRESLLRNVEAARDYLRARTNAVSVARMGLYAQVSAAAQAGIPVGEIAASAGWKTKKAVYDAIAIVKARTEGDDDA